MDEAEATAGVTAYLVSVHDFTALLWIDARPEERGFPRVDVVLSLARQLQRLPVLVDISTLRVVDGEHVATRHETRLHVPQLEAVQGQHELLVFLLSTTTFSAFIVHCPFSTSLHRPTDSTQPVSFYCCGRLSYLFVFEPGNGFRCQDEPVVLGTALHNSNKWIYPSCWHISSTNF